MINKKSAVILAFANLAGFIATVTVNALANILPLNNNSTGDLSDAYPNLFVPSGLTFSIWGVIYLLLAGYVVYQLVKTFRGESTPEFVDRIGPWFLLSSLVNIGWIFAWHWEMVGLSLIIMLIILFSLIMIYLKLNINRENRSAVEKVCVELPFSVYLGWITVATIANTTAFLVDNGWNGIAPGEVFWTVFVIAAAVLITLLVIMKRRDTGYTLVVIWALLGIYLKRSGIETPPDQGVEIAALAGMGITAAGLVVRLILSKRKG